MLTGAALCLVALLTLAYATDLVAVQLGYALLGGIGGGLVYLTCVATVADWFPERSAPLVGAALTGVMRQPGRPTLPVLPRGRADRP